MLVYPNRSSIELLSDAIGGIEILAPDASGQSERTKIGARNDIVKVDILQYRKNGSKLLLGHQPRAVVNITNDRRGMK